MKYSLKFFKLSRGSRKDEKDEKDDSMESCMHLVKATTPDAQKIVTHVDAQKDNRNAVTVVLAGSEEDEKDLKGLEGCSYGNVLVGRPDTFQLLIEELLQRCQKQPQYKIMHVVVSSTVESIGFDLSEVCKFVTITPVWGRESWLKIEGTSMYHGERAYIWELCDREKSNEYSLTLGYGCYHDTSGLPEAELQALQTRAPLSKEQLRMLQDMSEKEKEVVKRGLYDVFSELGLGRNASAAECSDSNRPPEWLRKLMAVLAGVCTTGGVGYSALGGAGAGVLAANKAGFFIKGPLGLSISTGAYHYSVAATWMGAVRAGGAAIGAGLVASTAVYLVPWARLFDWLAFKCRCIWESIKEWVSAIWETLVKWMHDAGSAIASAVFNISNSPDHSLIEMKHKASPFPIN